MKMIKKLNGRINKKVFTVALAFAAVLATALAGCGEKQAAKKDDAITIMTKQSHTELDYIQRIIALYEEQTGNKIKIIAYENAEFEKKAAEAYKNGDIPDILIHFNDSELAHYNVSENFYYMNDEPWVDELTEGARAYSLDRDGNILGLPFWESSVSGCYYNKTLFDSMGLRPAATQAEFDALCGALKSVGYTPLYWAAGGCNWMFQFGLDPIFADNHDLLERLNKNEITYADIPEVRNMVQWLYDANRQGWFNSDYEKAAWGDIPGAVENGDVAAIFVWDTWFFTNMKEGGKYSADDFALMPVFMNTAEMGTYEGGNLGMFMVNKNSEKLQSALDFLSFCAKPENYNIAFKDVPTVSCFKNQTTNIQSDMVTESMVSIEANQRVSTAWAKIIGYRQDDVGAAVLKMFKGEVDVDGCIKLMDEYRIAAAKEMGAAGF